MKYYVSIKGEKEKVGDYDEGINKITEYARENGCYVCFTGIKQSFEARSLGLTSYGIHCFALVKMNGGILLDIVEEVFVYVF